MGSVALVRLDNSALDVLVDLSLFCAHESSTHCKEGKE